MKQGNFIDIGDAAYKQLLECITTLWSEAKTKAVSAVNTELLEGS